jgi:hypothetical protein
MQRPEAKIHPRDRYCPAETANVKNRRQYPRRNGLFSIDEDFRGSGRLDGGADWDRTCDPPEHFVIPSGPLSTDKLLLVSLSVRGSVGRERLVNHTIDEPPMLEEKAARDAGRAQQSPGQQVYLAVGTMLH